MGTALRPSVALTLRSADLALLSFFLSSLATISIFEPSSVGFMGRGRWGTGGGLTDSSAANLLEARKGHLGVY